MGTRLFILVAGLLLPTLAWATDDPRLCRLNFVQALDLPGYYIHQGRSEVKSLMDRDPQNPSEYAGACGPTCWINAIRLVEAVTTVQPNSIQQSIEELSAAVQIMRRVGAMNGVHFYQLGQAFLELPKATLKSVKIGFKFEDTESYPEGPKSEFLAFHERAKTTFDIQLNHDFTKKDFTDPEVDFFILSLMDVQSRTRHAVIAVHDSQEDVMVILDPNYPDRVIPYWMTTNGKIFLQLNKNQPSTIKRANIRDLISFKIREGKGNREALLNLYSRPPYAQIEARNPIAHLNWGVRGEFDPLKDVTRKKGPTHFQFSKGQNTLSRGDLIELKYLVKMMWQNFTQDESDPTAYYFLGNRDKKISASLIDEYIQWADAWLGPVPPPASAP